LDPGSNNDLFVSGDVNQQTLFPRVAAVVHHGGAGTTTTATRAGVPQVIVPQIADQPYFAGRIATLGIGAAHDAPSPTLESLSAALRIALAPEIRAHVAEVSKMIRPDGVAVAAKLVLRGLN
jgi:vancomycin aglycone glucosyltransferase